jgi:small-conductance mechanosensitive channel
MTKTPTPIRRSAVKSIPIAVRRANALTVARKAGQQLALLTPLTAAVIAVYHFREAIFGLNAPVRIACGVTLVIIGWVAARDAAHALYPRLTSRLSPESSGVVGFIVRLGMLALAVLVALRFAGLKPGTIALGASATAIVLGLAAQQTVGNLLAGIVLLTARPFVIGDRVRFAGYGMDVEGTVASHGLLYVTLDDGEDSVLIPNNTALIMSARPIREPASVDMLARLPYGVDPEAVQKHVMSLISVPTKAEPHIGLEEFDGETVTMRVRATPSEHEDGARLARDILSGLSDFHKGESSQLPNS